MLAVVTSSLEFIEDPLTEQFVESALEALDLLFLTGKCRSSGLQFAPGLLEHVGLEVEAGDGQAVVQSIGIGDASEPPVEHVGSDRLCGEAMGPAEALGDDGGLVGGQLGHPLVDVDLAILDPEHQPSSSEFVPFSHLLRSSQRLQLCRELRLAFGQRERLEPIQVGIVVQFGNQSGGDEVPLQRCDGCDDRVRGQLTGAALLGESQGLLRSDRPTQHRAVVQPDLTAENRGRCQARGKCCRHQQPGIHPAVHESNSKRVPNARPSSAERPVTSLCLSTTEGVSP